MIQKLLLTGFIGVFAYVQQPNPVRWTYLSVRLPGDSFEVHMVASIPKGWHIYSQANTGGPGPTHFKFFKNPGIRTIGQVKELDKPIIINDQFFQTNARVFLQTATFVQILGRKDSTVEEFRGLVTFIACSDRNCLPPKTDSFRVELK